MQRPLQLSWHHIDPSEALAEHVGAHVARLERVYDRITGCVVSLEAPSGHHRHSGAQYRVRIELSVPGRKLVVGRDPPDGTARSDLTAAVDTAFREARRQLEDHVARLEERVKAPAPPAHAAVARLFPQDGYGFLRTRDDREIYFHERSVLRGGFERLRVGTEVRFVEEPGDAGPQASTVEPVHPRRRGQLRPGAAGRKTT